MRQIKFSPFKQELLGAACDDGNVELWDVQRRAPYHVFPKSHTMSCTSLTFSTVNHLLLCSAGLDQRIQFYDTSDKRIVKQVDCPAPITSLAFYTDGYTIAAGTLYGSSMTRLTQKIGTVLLFDLRVAVEPKAVLKGHVNNQINYLEFARTKKGKSQIPAAAVPAKDSRPSTAVIAHKKESKEPHVAMEPPTGSGKPKWKSIEDIREEAKRNVELRKKYRSITTIKR